MMWDEWGMFVGALEQYNDEEDTVVTPHDDPEPDSEPPPTMWPEDHEPLKFSVAQRIGALFRHAFSAMGFMDFSTCTACGAVKLVALAFCHTCGKSSVDAQPDMVRCPGGMNTCPLCAKTPGWLEELKS